MPIYASGFEAGSAAYYAAQGWTNFTISSAVVHTSLSGKSGAYSMVPNTCYTPSLDPVQTRWINFWMRTTNTTSVSKQFRLQFLRIAANQFGIQFLGGGQVLARLGAVVSGTIQGEAQYNPHVGHWISVELNANSTTGTCNVYIDGVLVISFSGNTAGVSGQTGWDQVYFYGAPSYYVDDLVITDVTEGRVDEHYIPGVIPTSDGVVAMTPSTGVVNALTVDEIPPSTVDYNEGIVVGDQDLYNHAVLPWSPASIHSVGLSAYAARDGIITGGQVAIKSGASTYLLPATAHAFPAGGTYDVLTEHWTLDPNGSIAWTEVNLNAAQIGFKIT